MGTRKIYKSNKDKKSVPYLAVISRIGEKFKLTIRYDNELENSKLKRDRPLILYFSTYYEARQYMMKKLANYNQLENFITIYDKF